MRVRYHVAHIAEVERQVTYALEAITAAHGEAWVGGGLRALSSLRLEPSPIETPPCDGHDRDLDVDLSNWPASGDFVVVRVGTGGELVDMTTADLGLWEILLGLDYLLYRP